MIAVKYALIRTVERTTMDIIAGETTTTCLLTEDPAPTTIQCAAHLVEEAFAKNPWFRQYFLLYPREARWILQWTVDELAKLIGDETPRLFRIDWKSISAISAACPPPPWREEAVG